MSVLQLNASIRSAFHLPTSIDWWDPDAECTLVLSQPATDPQLWNEYVDGAVRSYRRFGVECALDMDALRAGTDTILFWAAIDATGRVVGGVRAKGPLRSADESHAVVEWAGQPGEEAVRKMITDRAPFGIIEMKAAWVTDDPDRNGSLTKVLARSGFHAMPLLHNQFCMATSAAHVLERWSSSGGVVAPIPATPYPDERYCTKIMWWDRNTFADHAEPRQVSKIHLEMIAVAKRVSSLGEFPVYREIGM